MSLFLPDGRQLGVDFNFGFPGGAPDAVLGIPEPSTWAMMLIGFVAIGLVAKLRRQDLRPKKIAVALDKTLRSSSRQYT
jgi:hypothetical protein